MLVLLPHLMNAGVSHGVATLSSRQLAPGTCVDLAGEWLYRPGYAVSPDENPALSVSADSVPVPVPHLLNRIQWWLDDSEDFKRHETARLQKLGFDTDRAEDGWYYLRLNLPGSPKGKNLFIEFEGVAMISRTFCNGQLLGEHQGMFSRFGYQLTPHLRAGENLIAVFVSMEKIPKESLSMGEAVTVNLTASKVKTMSKGMFGPLAPNYDNRAYDLHGIWQPVKLVVRGGAKLEDVWFRPNLDGAEVRTEALSLAGALDARLKAKWTDAATGRHFAEAKLEHAALEARTTLHSIQLRNVQPKLWTPAGPNLYQLTVTLETASGEVLDSWTQNVGFRTFETRGNQFFLNGNRYWLRGANHLPYGKNPFDPALARRLIQSLHDANVGITRTHATPWNEAWLNSADAIGLAVSLEGIRPWALAGKIGATPPDLFAHWLMENEDIVKRARNHPSVFLYTVGNEMLLRDTNNLEKWRQLSELVRQTRRLDSTRPVICSSEYMREPELYNELLKPNAIDDGDADDMHRYNSWYGPSSFVIDAKFDKEAAANGGARPLMGQEMSSGYPDLDTGLPVLRYTRDLLTPQAWVGQFAYPGSDPKYFLEHHRAVTKRWAERLRFERSMNTAGFMLFAAECWFSHSYDATTMQPYPVVAAMREALAPVGLALETGRRRFFPGEQHDTAVFITNDDEQQRSFRGLRLAVDVLDRTTGAKISSTDVGVLPQLAFSETARMPVQFHLPAAQERRELTLQLRLLQVSTEISRTTDPVEIVPVNQRFTAPVPTFCRSLGPDLSRLLEEVVHRSPIPELTGAQVMWFGRGDDLSGFGEGGAVRSCIEHGATAIVFSPGVEFAELFSGDVDEGKVFPGEFADASPCAGTTLTANLAPMDLKWWGRKNDGRAFVADTSHRLRNGSRARELIRYIPPHGYISPDKIPEQYRTVMFEIPLGRGRLWVCDLDLEASVSVDPVARQFALNLLRAAADPHSTATLPRVATHNELLSARR